MSLRSSPRPPLVLLSCNCGSAPSLLYQFLKSHHVPSVLSVPLYKGDKALAFSAPYPALHAYVASQSGYAIIADTSATAATPPAEPRWADIGKHSTRATILAEEIVAPFAHLR